MSERHEAVGRKKIMDVNIEKERTRGHVDCRENY